MTTKEIAEYLAGTLVGDADTQITSVADLAAAGQEDVAFWKLGQELPRNAAGCVIIRPELQETFAGNAAIVVDDPKLGFARIAAKLYARPALVAGIHPTADVSASAFVGVGVFIGAHVFIGDSSRIGDGAEIRAGSYIGSGVSIGRNCVIHPNVVIQNNCTVGDDVVLHPGVVIGADGFGYVRDRDRYLKFPQIGTVVIENDVEIGAATCIDRGALGETRIGEGTKIDNLVQIAHNVQIGRGVIIAAQTGISGSTVIEDDCVIGGQVGMGDHARVKSGAVIGSQAGVLPGKIVRPGVWWGTPVQPLEEYKRQNARLKGLSRLKEEVRELGRRLAILEKDP